MQRVIVLISTAAWIFAVFSRLVSATANNFGASAAQREAAYLTKSFAATGAKSSSFLIHDYSTVNQRCMASKEFLTLAGKMSYNLGLTHVTAGQHVGKNEHILQLAGTWSNHMNASIVLSSFHMTDGMPDSTILVLRAQSDAGDLPELAHHMSAIANELKHLRIPVNLDPYITGYIQPLLSQEETNQVITKAFDTVDAKRIEGVTSNLVTSISGYSPEGPTYIMSKEKMNLQAALHWDGYNRHPSVVVETQN